MRGTHTKKPLHTVAFLAYAGTHCAFTQTDGQTELTWVAGIMIIQTSARRSAKKSAWSVTNDQRIQQHSATVASAPKKQEA